MSDTPLSLVDVPATQQLLERAISAIECHCEEQDGADCAACPSDIQALRTLAAQLPALVADRERLEWLEGEGEREFAINKRLNEEPGCGAEWPRSLFRQNVPITREAIDASRAVTGDGT